LALDVLRIRLDEAGFADCESRYELIGVNTILGDRIMPTPELGHEPSEVRLRLAMRVKTTEQAKDVVNEVEALYLNGPASGGGATKSVREVIAAASVLIPRDWVSTTVLVLEN
jgi:hypothetical protein